MYNLRTVIGFEFSRTIRKKSFWLSTLAVPALIGLIFAVSFYSDKSAKQSATPQQFSLMVLDDSKLIPPAVLRASHARVATSKQAGIDAVKNGSVDAFFYYPPDPSKGQVEVYGRDVGIIKNNQYNQAASTLVQTGVAAGIAPEKVALIQDSASTTLTVYKDGQVVDDSINRILAPALFPVLFFVLIVLLANQMLSTTTEEKENRVIELILTTVSSRALIIGKIVALMGVGLIQILVVVVPSLVAYQKLHPLDLSKVIINPAQIAFGAVTFIGGFLLFTGMLIAIGAAVPTAKEANRFLGFAILSMLAPLYAAAAIVTSPDKPIVKVFTFVPFFAPVTLMLRNALGNLSPAEALTGVVIVLASAIVAVIVAIQSFRFGSLQFTRKLTLKEIFGRA